MVKTVLCLALKCFLSFPLNAIQNEQIMFMSKLISFMVFYSYDTIPKNDWILIQKCSIKSFLAFCVAWLVLKCAPSFSQQMFNTEWTDHVQVKIYLLGFFFTTMLPSPKMGRFLSPGMLYHVLCTEMKTSIAMVKFQLQKLQEKKEHYHAVKKYKDLYLIKQLFNELLFFLPLWRKRFEYCLPEKSL